MVASKALQVAFATRMLQIFGLRPPRRLGLSVSGGVDSMALAGLTAQWARPRNVELHAFIVNHNLRHGSSAEAAAVAQALRDMLGIDSSVLDLHLGANPARIEELARTGRRTVLEDACTSARISSLLMGHHLNDQAELFVQRLINGSSWFGLAGMAAKTLLKPLLTPDGPPPVTIVRPLLQTEKRDLRAWCEREGIPWWEDPTNEDTSLTKRNLIRRMYALGAEPQSLALDKLAELMAFFGQQRAKAERIADLAVGQLVAAERLVYHQGSAQLELGPDIRSLPLMVRIELLFRIIAPISPYNEDKLFTRRHRLRALAEDLPRRDRQLQTALGVKVTGSAARWTLYRETARKMDQLKTEVYQACSEWSSWTLIDNRWWVRWRLPASTAAVVSSSSQAPTQKFFSVRMLAKPDSALEALSGIVAKDALRELRRVCVSHPFFMWSDPKNPDAIDYTKFIGFPTLDVSRGLDLEVQPKEYAVVDQP